MELVRVIEQFECNLRAIEELTKNLSEEQARWKRDNKWSVLEIINHLYDEECDDFRLRLTLIIEDPRADWPSIDPPTWVTERKYNERDLDKSLQKFIKAREDSILWLKSLRNVPWSNSKEHPLAGTMTASRILYSWLAHDYLHIRQISAMLFKHLESNVSPIPLNYAGEL